MLKYFYSTWGLVPAENTPLLKLHVHNEKKKQSVSTHIGKVILFLILDFQKLNFRYTKKVLKSV